jgi:oligopeptide transport system permease protein
MPLACPAIDDLNLTPWQKFKANSMSVSGLSLLFILILFTAIGPFISNYRYDEIHLNLKNMPPSFDFWFGTDDLGRDIFTRVWYGARISYCVGLSAACIDLTLGVLWGSLAGLCGKRWDECLMRLLDIFYSIPTLLIAILITVVLGSGMLSIILAINAISWISMARIVRGQMLLLKEMDYVLAAKSLGAGFSRILFRHLLPNAWGAIMITLTMTIPTAIFSEAFLSFLGLGIQAPMASWGTMAYDGLPALEYYPWRLFFPSLFISLTMIAFYLIGEGLKAAYSQANRTYQ